MRTGLARRGVLPPLTRPTRLRPGPGAVGRHRLVRCRLPDRPGAVHAAARRFCLDTIEQVYGIGYRPDWHADLDGLCLGAELNRYAAMHRGTFWTLSDPDGAIVATAGIHHLGWKPATCGLFPGRYPSPDQVGSMSRVYIRSDLRGAGVGTWLVRLVEAEAAAMGYRTLYLHAASDTPASLAFWRSCGYAAFGTCDTSTHFDRQIASQAAAKVPSAALQAAG